MLDRSLYAVSKFITVNSADDIAWFATRSTASLPFIPVCEGTHVNLIVFVELAIMLIICWEIAFDGSEDSREVKGVAYDKSFISVDGFNVNTYSFIR